MGGWRWFVWAGGGGLYGRVAVVCMVMVRSLLLIATPTPGEVSRTMNITGGTVYIYGYVWVV